MNNERKFDSGRIVAARRAVQDMAASDLDSPLWDETDVAPITRYWSGEDAPRSRHAEARLIWSSNSLCVRFICCQEEPLIVSPHPQTLRKTIGLWDRDVCELFIAPDEREPRRYYEFEAAPTGEWLDLAVHQMEDERETDWEYHSGMTTAARILSNQVIIAIRVPWEALGRAPRSGERWRANLTRCVGAEGTTTSPRGYLAWQPTYSEQPNFHAPEFFGEILFA